MQNIGTEIVIQIIRPDDRYAAARLVAEGHTRPKHCV